jgi:hypothetical protein
MIRTADSPTMSNMVVTVLWSATVVGALVLFWHGLWAQVYFEGTDEALAAARRGRFVLLGACLLLVAAAGFAVFVARWPVGLGIAAAAPVVLLVLGWAVLSLLRWIHTQPGG